MKCDEVIALLDPLLDNELPTQPTALVMEHIAACPSCRDVWDDRLALREQFKQLAANIAVPDTALERVDHALQKAASRETTARLWHLVISSAAAVILVISTVAAFRYIYRQEDTPATVAEIVSSYSKAAAPSPTGGASFKLDALSKHAGFKIANLNLPAWRLVGADTVKLPGHSECLVRLTYQEQGGVRQITCYEACKGQIKVAGLNEHNIGGRYICCGKVHNFSVIYWPRDGRDNLLVSSLSESDLMALALST